MKSTERPARPMNVRTATLIQPRMFWRRIPPSRKRAWMMVTKISRLAAQVRWRDSDDSSMPIAKRKYFPKTTQLLAVKPRSMAWTAMMVLVRKRGRSYMNSR